MTIQKLWLLLVCGMVLGACNDTKTVPGGDTPPAAENLNPGSTKGAVLKMTPVDKIMVTKRKTALRRRLDPTDEIVDFIKSGEQVHVVAQTKGWYQIVMGVEKGYVNADTLRDLECRMKPEWKENVIMTRVVTGRALIKDYYNKDACLPKAQEDFDRAWNKFQKDCGEMDGDLVTNMDSVSKAELSFVKRYYHDDYSWRCSINDEHDLKEESGWKKPVLAECFEKVKEREREICE